ncbi:MAG: diadenylate cyclase CdaA [Lachnospiraceae bacterium]|nr:diadenylate cyclase CdaA [Lachnospiraceae bacterium]
MEEAFKEIITNLKRYVPSIELSDVLEMLIIAFLIYHIMLWIQKTRAWTLLKGLLVILIFWGVASYFNMSTILWLGRNVIGFAVTAILIVLQPELRKALEELGNKNLIANVLPFDSGRKDVDNAFTEKTVNEITRACVEMSKVKTGALIVIEQKQSLSDYERTGIYVDGLVTSQLLINIFEHNTPLHDGAVIIRGNRVTSATCYLPLTDNGDISKEVGTRHRAGVGISEATDSIMVIVSEQTGKISVAVAGQLERNFDGERLKERLKELTKRSEDTGKSRRRWKGKGKQEA